MNSLKTTILKTTAIAIFASSAPVLAQVGPSTAIPNSPSNSGTLNNPQVGATGTVQGEDDGKKRRKNAPNKEGMLDKGDKYGFDDFAGVKVKMDTQTSEKMMAEFTHCLAKHRPNQALAYLGTLPENKNIAKARKPMMEKQCLGRQSFNLTILELDDNLLRAALFDALYSKRYTSVVSADLSKLPPANYAQELNASAEQLPKVINFQRKFGDCVVRQAVKEAHALISTPIWGDGEESKIAAVTPAMQRCLPPTANIKFSKTLLRGMLAESLFKFNSRLGQNTALLAQ
jgi:hypothetical protein